jgi:citrate lyase subunit beta/citryl-CoA lyase
MSVSILEATALRPNRSVLYVPGSNSKAIAKVKALACDTVILDLEDGVSPEVKVPARNQAVAAIREASFGSRIVVLRVNGLDTEWGSGDLAAAATSSADAILIPKIEEPADVYRHQVQMGRDCRSELWAMIETPRSILNIGKIAATGGDSKLKCLVLGTNDLAKALRVRPGVNRTPFLGMFGQCVAAARAFGLQILDGVYNNIEDTEGFIQQCVQAADFGFDGKTLIHPRQVEPCNAAFSPNETEIALARQIVRAFEDEANAAKGAILLNGEMVERLHLIQAQHLLARIRVA